MSEQSQTDRPCYSELSRHLWNASRVGLDDRDEGEPFRQMAQLAGRDLALRGASELTTALRFESTLVGGAEPRCDHLQRADVRVPERAVADCGHVLGGEALAVAWPSCVDLCQTSCSNRL